ncbi:MAG: ATP-binding protein [Patescibacteria group bacterium]|nr:ATP-binding protein [Patescibacteria group bacterium]
MHKQIETPILYISSYAAATHVKKTRVGQAKNVRAGTVMLGFGKKHSAAGIKNLEASLQDQQRRFEIIINGIEDGVMLIDNQQNIQLFNPGATKITGWPGDEATGLNIHQVITLVNDKGEPIPTGETIFTTIWESSESMRDNTAVLVNRSKDQIPVNVSITPLLNETGEATAAVAVFSDVSQERAEEKQRADFISTASHEMRTPVAAIEGYLSLALNDKVATIDARARNYLEKAHSSTEHLGQLFQDLLTSAKAADGRLTSHPTVVELGGFLEQLTTELRFVAEKKGLFVDFIVGSSTTINATNQTGGERVVRPFYYVLVDGDRLREVITNLFDNAVKYTPEGRISLGLTGNDQVVQCYVRDTGPGIPAQDLPHLFQKFYRVDNSATRTIGGTGLGLFICRKIVELYKGRIWAESEVGKGSTFYINLPRLTTQKANELQSAATSTTELQPISSLATP